MPNRRHMENIDYNFIDEECTDMVRFFNDYGLKTQFSCQGHEDEIDNTYFIIFDDCVSDEDIENFILPFEGIDSRLRGSFVKWVRKLDGKVKYNWQYQITCTDEKTNYKWAKEDLSIFKKYHQTQMA